MRALFREVHGEPENVISVREVDRPTVPDDGVLVRVRAASIHIGDCHVVRGVPKSMRPMFGVRRPSNPIPGMDLAGVVEAVGSAVTSAKVGDKVFGNGGGAFAEYAVAKADDLTPRPESLSFEEAAALGVSAQTALQALRDQLTVEPGERFTLDEGLQAVAHVATGHGQGKPVVAVAPEARPRSGGDEDDLAGVTACLEQLVGPGCLEQRDAGRHQR